MLQRLHSRLVWLLKANVPPERRLRTVCDVLPVHVKRRELLRRELAPLRRQQRRPAQRVPEAVWPPQKDPLVVSRARELPQQLQCRRKNVPLQLVPQEPLLLDGREKCLQKRVNALDGPPVRDH